VREREVVLRRVAVNDLSAWEASAFLERRRFAFRFPDARSTGPTAAPMIIGEVGNHVDDELVLVEAGRGSSPNTARMRLAP